MKSGMPMSDIGDALLDAFGKVTAMLSNVPGPLTKVNFMGQEVDDLSFYAMGPIGLYFGIVQYNGQFKAGICTDAALESEPKRLADCWLPAFKKLSEAANQMVEPEVTIRNLKLQVAEAATCTGCTRE